MTVTGPLAGAATKTPAAALTLSGAEKKLTTFENAAGSGVSLTETGSSLFYPLFSTWAQSYHAASLQTASTGSGAGQSGALKGTVNIGASDAYLPASDPSTLLNIPVVVSAQQINYNVPGLKAGTHLKLDATVLNGMYTGQITNWDDSAITKLNPGVKIPSLPVVTIHRSDSSGDTFIFSSYLDYQDPSSFVEALGGPNTAITFPSVPGAIAANGNTGMLQACQATVGCVAYIGVSYLSAANAAHLGYAQLLNGSGNYELPTPVNVENEVASYKHIPTNGAISLVDSKNAKKGYPIVNFEYAIVEQNQPNTATANAIKALLAWGMDPRHGAAPSFLDTVNFKPMAPNALAVAINLLNTIS
jgi:phosphate transport system substrate-binding protein